MASNKIPHDTFRVDGVWHAFCKPGEHYHVRLGGRDASTINISSYTSESSARSAAEKWVRSACEAEAPFDSSIGKRVLTPGVEAVKGRALPVQFTLELERITQHVLVWREEPVPDPRNRKRTVIRIKEIQL